MRAQCIRVLPPISGPITSVAVAAGGSGYTSPTVAISAPDMPSGALPNANGLQATATATVSGGAITAVHLTNPGDGYFQPTVTITDPTGSGATANPVVGNIFTLNAGQEVYPFSAVPLANFAGVDEVYQVQSVSIIYLNYRYSCPVYSFSTYQAMIRQYVASQYLYVPTFGSQFGRGAGGSFYLYPPPSQTYPMEWDCRCLPSDLAVDADPEAIPDPWTDLVPYFAAYLAYLELQNHNLARSYLDQFDSRMKRFGGYALPGRVSNPYGRFVWLLLTGGAAIAQLLSHGWFT